jgi:hypothetical protein
MIKAMKKTFPKKYLQELFEAYGKELFKEIVNGIVPGFDFIENRQTRNFNQCLS